jgi:hypothetical protein
MEHDGFLFLVGPTNREFGNSFETAYTGSLTPTSFFNYSPCNYDHTSPTNKLKLTLARAKLYNTLFVLVDIVVVARFFVDSNVKF